LPATLHDVQSSTLTGPFDLAYTRLDPPVGFEIHAATLAALRDRATGMGIAADRIDGLAGELLTAKDGGYEWVSSPFFLDLTLRKPLG